MKKAILILIAFSLISGISLLLISLGWNVKILLFFFGLGVLSIVAAIAYTVGKKPYGYSGLGDLSVLTFFGLVGVLGSTYLFTQQISLSAVLPALSCGFFSIGVLNINNIRDIESDRAAGKFSIPVRIGKKNAAYYQWLLLAAGVLTSITFVLLDYQSPVQFLFLLTVPFFFKIGNAVTSKPSQELDPFLKQMAVSTLLFVLLFGTGMLAGT